MADEDKSSVLAEAGVSAYVRVEIIVGPVHADLKRPVIRRLLDQHGYKSTKVETGRVALRTSAE